LTDAIKLLVFSNTTMMNRVTGSCVVYQTAQYSSVSVWTKEVHDQVQSKTKYIDGSYPPLSLSQMNCRPPTDYCVAVGYEELHLKCTLALLPGRGRCGLLTITGTMQNGTRLKCSGSYSNDTTFFFPQKYREFYCVINMTTHARENTMVW